MADKIIADKIIGDLPSASAIKNNDLFVLEQNGTAKKLSGRSLSDYVYNAAGEKVKDVAEAVQWAQDSVDDIAAAVDSMAGYGTDKTLTVANAAADAEVAGFTRSDYNLSHIHKKSILYSLPLGPYSIAGNEENGYRPSSSAQTLGMSKFVYADKPITILKKMSAATSGIHFAVNYFEYDSTHDKYIGKNSPLWFDNDIFRASIPSGVYYWIGFRDGNNPHALTKDILAANYEVFEVDNNLGFGQSSTSGATVSKTVNGLLNIDIKYTDKDLSVKLLNDVARCTYEKYANDSPFSYPTSVQYSIDHSFVIPKGTYYRLVYFNESASQVISDDYEYYISLFNENYSIEPTVSANNLIGNADGMYKKDMLSRLPFGNYSVAGNETNGFKPSDSESTFGMSEFLYTEHPIIVQHKPDKAYSGVTIAVQYFEKSGNKFINQHGLTGWFNERREFSFIQPGVYYWIGFRDGNNPHALTIDEVSKYYDIYETYDNYALGANSDTINHSYSHTKFNNVMHIEPLYATEDMLLTATNWKKCIYTYASFGTSYNPYSAPSEFLYSQRKDLVIPRGTYYRVTMWHMGDDGTAIDYSSSCRSIDDLKKIILPDFKIEPLRVKNNYFYDNFQIDALGLDTLIANLSRRLDVVEKANSINTIPSYYTSHLESKVSTINGLRPADGSQFIFITDIHNEGYTGRGGNQFHAHALINYICQNTTITKVFNGGDLLNNDENYTIPRSISRIRGTIAYAQPDVANGKQFYIVGNHDGGLDYRNDETISPRHVTPDMLAVASGVYSVAMHGVHYDPHSPFQYYYDDPSEKIRYIVLDIGERDNATEETYTNSWIFFADALYYTPNSWHIVVFNHISGYNVDTGTISTTAYIQYILDPLDAYKARTSYTLVGYTRDFSACTGVPACVIFGHHHCDAQGTTTGGIPWFLTTTDNAGARKDNTDYSQYVSNVIGTVNEQAFDVFTINKTTRKINVTRIGQFSNRSATY